MNLFKFKHSLLGKLVLPLPKNINGHRVLMYHSIYRDSSPFDIFAVSEHNFQEQMKLLSESKLNILQDPQSSNNASISVTFDDGFRDNLTLALPILKNYQIPATIFVATDLIDKPGYLTKEELKLFAKSELITIGAHGHKHRPLANIDINEAFEEITISKKILEEITEKNITTFSFPHGSYNDHIAKFLKDCGYSTIYSSEFGINNIGDSAIYKRVSIFDCDNNTTFKQKINGKWDIFKHFLSVHKKISNDN